MCSIIGYAGSRQAAPILVDGLRRMEYRGYDSVGVATISGNQIIVRKGVGKVNEVNARLHLDELSGNLGIGHTRWATHGCVSDVDAHPHLSSSGGIAIVHNGIIDNYLELKQDLESQGYPFQSATDSEVIANDLQRNQDLTRDHFRSMMATCSRLKGRYAFIAIFDDGTIGAARFHEPIVIGVGKEGYYISSDILGFVKMTDDVIYLDDGEFLLITPKGISTFDFEGRPTKHLTTKVSKELGENDKSDYFHYTLKEIHEQSSTIPRAGQISELKLDRIAELVKSSKKIFVTGSGTSFNSALVGKYLFSKYAKINIEPIISSESEFSPVYFDDKSLLIALSQSGETADVLETVECARACGSEIVSIVNVMSSSLPRMSTISVGINCGPEIGVAATKSFTAQLSVLYKLADRLSGGEITVDFEDVSSHVSRLLLDHSKIKDIAKEIKSITDIYILGKGIHNYIAMEAALKLKELAYIHAESLPGGELKHGPLALLDSSSHVLAINPTDSTYGRMSTTIREVKARGAKIIGISNTQSEIYDYWIELPTIDDKLYPLVESVPIQLLAYYSALERNANPDYPRNLAKSVTVS